MGLICTLLSVPSIPPAAEQDVLVSFAYLSLPAACRVPSSKCRPSRPPGVRCGTAEPAVLAPAEGTAALLPGERQRTSAEMPLRATSSGPVESPCDMLRDLRRRSPLSAPQSAMVVLPGLVVAEARRIREGPFVRIARPLPRVSA